MVFYGMAVAAAVLLISLALPTVSQDCSIRPLSSHLPGPRQARNDEEYDIIVNVACLPTQLQITWELRNNAHYDADINYICVDTNGTIIVSL